MSPVTNTEKRHPRRIRWAARGALAGLVVLAVVYLRCGGGGFGFGGGGLGVGGGSGVGLRSPATPRPLSGDEKGRDAGALRCQLRLDGTGLWQLGATGQAKVEVAAAVASCKAAGGADVVITGDARQGAWDELRAALDGAGVPSFVRGGGASGATAAPPGGGASQ